MKFSQAIAKLEENQKLKFKDQYGFIASLNEDGYLVLERNDITKSLDLSLKVGSSHLPADNWAVFQEPVDFMVAANSGKRIKSETWGGCYFLHEVLRILQNHDAALGLINGKWFIEC